MKNFYKLIFWGDDGENRASEFFDADSDLAATVRAADIFADEKMRGDLFRVENGDLRHLAEFYHSPVIRFSDCSLADAVGVEKRVSVAAACMYDAVDESA